MAERQSSGPAGNSGDRLPSLSNSAAAAAAICPVLQFGLGDDAPAVSYAGALEQAHVRLHVCASADDIRAALRTDRIVAGLLHLGHRADELFPSPALETLIEMQPTLRLIAMVEKDRARSRCLERLLQWGVLYDFHTLPADVERLLHTLGHIRGLVEIEDIAAMPTGIEGVGEPYMIGSHPAMLQVFHTIRKIADTDAPILITGESGTGKELAARAIHERSAFAQGPFVAVNCAALPPTLIESELFGHEKGSFTGAHQRKIGRIEAARGGTLFLDEIGDLPLDVQGHFLRFLQEKTIERVGSTRSITVDVRVVAATNVELKQAMEAGRFREDLYYRLNVLHVHMPPLCERGEDIELITAFFLRKFSKELRRPFRGFSDGARAAIRAYPWPGNVRELISSVRRAVVMADGKWITAVDLGLPDGSAERPHSVPTLEAARHELERDLVRRALDLHNQKIQPAARSLGVSRVTLYRLVEKYGIKAPEADAEARAERNPRR